jgi:predicted nucleotidyltransferase component of viral defense system
MQRLQCRDLYDLNELLVVRGIDAEAAWPTFERKTRHRGLDPDIFARRFDERTQEWQRRWETELAEYVTLPPHFDGLLRAVRRELRFALK